MSLKAKQAVIEDSPSRGNNRLVLMAIADCANDLGVESWPSQEYIAQWANCSVRSVQRAVQELVDDGELRVQRGNTRETNSYTVMAAWNRAMRLQKPSDGPDSDTRQVDGSPHHGGPKPADSGANAAVSCGDEDTPDKLTGVTRQVSPVESGRGESATGVNLTRQIDGGEKTTPDNVGGSDTTLLAGQIRPLTALSPARARPDKLTGVPRSNGSLIPRNPSGAWERGMERQHSTCHPDICNWRDSKIRTCMPLALVDTYARKLPGLPYDDAIADVIGWARKDVPPADYVAPGDTYAHWRIRWDLTRANAQAGRVSAGALERSTVPSAAATDALIREMTGGRTA